MATYRLNIPGRGLFDVTAPEGASEEDILAYARQQLGQAGPGGTDDTASPPNPGPGSIGPSDPSQLGRGMDDKLPIRDGAGGVKWMSRGALGLPPDLRGLPQLPDSQTNPEARDQALHRLVALRLMASGPTTATNSPVSGSPPPDLSGTPSGTAYNPWTKEQQLTQLVAQRLLAGRPLTADDVPAAWLPQIPAGNAAPNAQRDSGAFSVQPMRPAVSEGPSGLSTSNPLNVESRQPDVMLAGAAPARAAQRRGTAAPTAPPTPVPEPPVSRIGIDVATQIDAAGKDFTKNRENPTGPFLFPTQGMIGYSHTITPAEAGKYNGGVTQAEADAIFEKDIADAQAAVKSQVKVPLTQNMFNALTDFVYQAGARSLRESEILRALNSGNYLWAESAIPATRAGTPGVYNRRLKEAELFGTRWKE